MKKTFVTLSIFLCFAAIVTACSKSDENKILETAVPLGGDGCFYYLPNDVIEENLTQEILSFQEQLLSYCFVYDEEADADILHLRLLSMDSGELLYETSLQTAGSYAVVVQVCKNQIVVSDAQAGKLVVYDKTLKETGSFEAVGERIYVNPSVTEAYCLTSADGIRILNLKSGKERVILENARDLTFCCESGQDITVKYIDISTVDKKECYAGLHLENGELEVLGTDDSFSAEIEYQEGVWAGALLAETDTYFVGTQKKPYKFEKQLSYPSIQLTGEKNQFVLVETDLEGSQSVSAYQTDGKFLSAGSLKETGGMLNGRLLWKQSAEGYFFIVTDSEGYDKLCFWDLSQKTEGDDLKLIPYDTEEESAGEALEASYYEQAKSLSEKFHATIKIADQCATDYGDKTAKQECTPEVVKTAMEVLEKALLAYPDNFFAQLHYGAYRKTEINLVGEITNKETIEGYLPTAFVQHENGKITMVLNICSDAELLERTFYHETSHIIDQVLAHDAQYREDALYSEEKWQSLNPDKFTQLNPENGGYYGSYEMLPMSYYDESLVPYFASDYGKSFPTEDRATIFEGAMAGSLQKSLREKLEYYCECIRDCFDTSGWPNSTTWEETLKAY